MKNSATKEELKSEITRLESELSRQRNATEKMGDKSGVCVMLPWASHVANRGGAPYLPPGQWESRVVMVLANMIRQYGVKVYGDGSSRAPFNSRLYLSDSCGGDGFVVPTLISKWLPELLNGCAEVCNSAYSHGFKGGSDLLARLRDGGITADQFDESLDREKAREAQGCYRLV